MPVRYEITAAGVVSVAMTGVVGPGDVIDFLRALAADPALRPAMPQLLDMRGVTRAAPVADLERVAYAFEQMRPQFAGARCAVLVATPVMFGMVRQFGTLAERAGLDVTPFVDEGRAWSWLGVVQQAAGGGEQ